jgi:hypothetical protein
VAYSLLKGDLIMLNQQTGRATAEDFHRVMPALAGIGGDDFTGGEDQPAAAREAAPEFERRVSLADFDQIRRTFEAEQKNAIIMRQTAETGTHKVVLPRRPGEPRFGPPQYYYRASKTGVVPGATRV